MSIEDIKLIHEKEEEIKRKIEALKESKRKELLSLDQYYTKRLSEVKMKLLEEVNKYREEKSKEAEKEVAEIKKQTEQLIEDYESIDKSLINKAKEFIKENIFKI